MIRKVLMPIWEERSNVNNYKYNFIDRNFTIQFEGRLLEIECKMSHWGRPFIMSRYTKHLRVIHVLRKTIKL